MNKKKALAVILSCGLISAMVLGGSLAYLTDNEAHTNTVQVSGNIRIDLVEEHWNTTDTNSNGVPDDAERTVPNQEIPKDPKVINTGENPTYVFLRMTVPVKDVTRVTDNGTLVKKDGVSTAAISPASGNNGPKYHEPQELFFFKRDSDATSLHENHFYTPNDGSAPGWIRLDGREYNTETASTSPYAYKEDNACEVGQAVYVFGYNTVLAPGVETTQLYDLIQIKNIIENEVASDQIQNIKLEAFGIQSDNILKSDGTPMSTQGYRTMAELTEIYDIFVQQNGKVDNTNAVIGDRGDFIWNTYQDTEHGQVEKEAHINNERDINNTTTHNATTFDVVNGFSASRTNLLVGQTATTTVVTTSTREGAAGYRHYESSNEEVATVSTGGVITAKKAGDATITVTVDPGVQGSDGVYQVEPVRRSIEIHVWNDSRDQLPDTNVDVNDADYNPSGTTQP